MDLNLTHWKQDGRGAIESVGEDEFEVCVETPFTLWCPDEVSGAFRLSFDCWVRARDSAMLLMACARSWRGKRLLEVERAGEYDEYRAGDMELYTVGFNRTGHVSSAIQPNASTANVRRIGGPDCTAFAGNKEGLGTASPDMERWRCWNTHSLLASAREFASGTDRYFHYEFLFQAPKIVMHLEGEELLTVVDHKPNPLAGGVFGLRNMTPGGIYRVKNIGVEKLS